jgi:ribonuclease J
MRKIMVIDLYTAYTLHKLSCLSDSLPQYDWPEMRVVPWWYQQQRLIDGGQSEFVEATKKHKWISWDKMKERKRNIVLLMRSNRKVLDVESQLGDEIGNVKVIWSMWSGYWEQDQYVRPMCERHGIEQIKLHTGGHASWNDLQRFVEGIRPRVVVPIHTDNADRFAEHLSNVRLLDDGEVLTV